MKKIVVYLFVGMIAFYNYIYGQKDTTGNDSVKKPVKSSEGVSYSVVYHKLLLDNGEEVESRRFEKTIKITEPVVKLDDLELVRTIHLEKGSVSEGKVVLDSLEPANVTHPTADGATVGISFRSMIRKVHFILDGFANDNLNFISRYTTITHFYMICPIEGQKVNISALGKLPHLHKAYFSENCDITNAGKLRYDQVEEGKTANEIYQLAGIQKTPVKKQKTTTKKKTNNNNYKPKPKKQEQLIIG